MKTTILTMLGVLVLAFFTSHAQAADPMEPYPVVLHVGEVFQICKSGEVICPAIATICDDLKIIDLVLTPDGLGFNGISRGRTLCSAGSINGQRRVFGITVR